MVKETRRQNNTRISVSYGGGSTCLFIRKNPENSSFDLVDYEYQREELHDELGGKQYYFARSGLSGAGYVETLKDLIPVGYYRVDTVPMWHEPEALGGGFEIMVPYMSHQEDKSETLDKYPVVIRGVIRGNNKIIFTNFEDLYEELPEIMSGKFFEENQGKTVTREFNSQRGFIKELTFEWFNNFRSFDGISFKTLWEFAGVWIPKEARVERELDRLEKLFWFVGEDGCYYETFSCPHGLYRGERLKTSPLYDRELLPKQWEIHDHPDYSGYKLASRTFKDGNVKIVVWSKSPDMIESYIYKYVQLRSSRGVDAYDIKQQLRYIVHEEKVVSNLEFKMNSEDIFKELIIQLEKGVKQAVIDVKRQLQNGGCEIVKKPHPTSDGWEALRFLREYTWRKIEEGTPEWERAKKRGKLKGKLNK